MKFFVKNIFSKWKQIRKNLRIYSYLLTKSLTKILICVHCWECLKNGIKGSLKPSEAFQNGLKIKLDLGFLLNWDCEEMV